MPLIELNGKRILYIHVPKTGGTTVETWLESLAPLRFRTVGVPSALNCTAQHLRYEDFEELFGEGAFDYAFMTVRDPFARLASEYRMQIELAKERFFGEMQKFTPWLAQTLARFERDPFVLDNHIRPQWEFGGDDVEVFRLEEGLETILARVAGKIGVPAPEGIAHALKTGGTGPKTKGKWARARDARAAAARPAPRLRWTKANIRRVREFYAADFEEFGYPDTAPEAG
ncbi:sulfotransferase family 2 domain-containing protein [Mesobacterium pallidum]|uniref:sulfotransferase family 2 domain-containing protein n=1 Tax=Mesobacterium pallidum TaxID=2872037 RepID=UPI001EE1C448|nr:sulfotransferase family 2 domain-containing protein [Mesobacterium pallidum]